MKTNTTSWIVALAVIALGVIFRIAGAESQLYNFAPIAAIGLFAGAMFKDMKVAFLVAIASQFIADLYFAAFTQTPGFYGVSQLFTYVGLIGATLIGKNIKSLKSINIIGGSLAASIVFFALSNLGHFAQGWNGYTSAGFLKTYIDAIPFFKASLFSDLLGSTILFGVYALINKAVYRVNLAK